MITEGTPHWRRGLNRHSIYMHSMPLGVTCTCGRRAALPQHKLGSLQGNMDSIHTLKLRCSSCGSRDWIATLFITMAEVEEFLGRAMTDEELVP